MDDLYSTAEKWGWECELGQWLGELNGELGKVKAGRRRLAGRVEWRRVYEEMAEEGVVSAEGVLGWLRSRE